MKTLLPWIISLGAAIPVPVAHAQTTLSQTTAGVSGGIAMRTNGDVSQVGGLGPAVSGQVTRRFGPRLGARAQTLLARFGHQASQGDLGPCFPTVECQSDLKGALTLAGATGSVVVYDDQTARTGSGAHYLLGGSVYKPLRAPDGVYSLGVGWSIGLGFDLGSPGTLRGTIEVKYERIRQSRDRQFTIIPLTFGVAW